MRAREFAFRLKDYLANGVVEVVLNLSGLVSGILLARILGAEGRGQLAAALLWPTTLGNLLGLGLQHAFAYGAGVGWAKPRDLSAFALKYAGLVGVPAAVVYWYAAPWLLRHQFTSVGLGPRLMALAIPIALYGGMIHPILQGQGAFGAWNAARLVRGAGWTLAVGILAVIGLASVTSLVGAQVVVLLLFAVLCHGLCGGGPSRPLTSEVRSRLFRYGMAIYASGLAYMVNSQLDQLLLSQWVLPAGLGLYVVSVSLSNALLIIPSAVGAIVFSKMAREGPDGARRKALAGEALGLTVACLTPAVLALALLAPWVIHLLYGTGFEGSVAVLRILAPAAFFLGVGQTMADLLRGMGRPMLASYGVIAGAVVTIPTLLVLLPRYGILGAAWVSFGAYVLLAIIQGIFLLRLLSCPPCPASTISS